MLLISYLNVYVEPLITKSKEDTTASRRVVFSYLQNKYAITELFGEIAKAEAPAEAAEATATEATEAEATEAPAETPAE